ncbi:MAG TPA: DUF1501 domain-containing protein [Planctomycetota bacterium]|nr:DUF1501 domain-containing protein [Planctomycetota bacterium]
MNCKGITRRSFLADTGMGFTGLALGAALFRDGIAAQEPAPAPPDGRPHLQPKAKSVIWIFMAGGVSHLEGFDPKPELNRYAGKSISATPYKDSLESRFVKDNVKEVVAGLHKVQPNIFPLQTGFRKHGESGLEVSDWWSQVGDCADDLAVVRSLWTTDNDHGAQLQFHTGRHALEGPLPTIGSWIHYGLGSLNDNLPQFIVLGNPLSDCCGGVNGHGAHYLGPEHAGVRMVADPKNPLPFASPGAHLTREEQTAEFDLLGRLNRLAGVDYPDDPVLRARIKSYELAFRMQTAVPEVFRYDDESPETQRLYGLDRPVTREFGMQCLGARRLVERGVRFIQIFHGTTGAAGGWDAHSGLKNGHRALCAQADQPIAGLLRDLKRRGLLDETLVVWASEFGRTAGAEGSDGRDHSPFGFSAWLAGGGVKGGTVHGKTDELGFHAVENRHYVTDLHATVLHQMGLDPRRLEVPGRKRLDIDFGKPIREILA